VFGHQVSHHPRGTLGVVPPAGDALTEMGSRSTEQHGCHEMRPPLEVSPTLRKHPLAED
jgi:hypothetical protein